MDSTHFWYRPQHIQQNTWDRIVADMRTLLPVLDQSGVDLAGPSGSNTPILDHTRIGFNYQATEDDLVEAPFTSLCLDLAASDDAPDDQEALSRADTMITLDGPMDRESGLHCAFYLSRYLADGPFECANRLGPLFLAWCRTGFRPYDLAVTAALVILDHYVGDEAKIVSTGKWSDWKEGMLLCQMELGYGMAFQLDYLPDGPHYEI